MIGDIKQATVVREADGWYVSIQTEYVITGPQQARGDIGVDRGVAVFAATSDGELVEPLSAFAQSIKQLTRLQRQLSRKEKGSKNRRKARAKVARMHQHIRRQREDFLHHVSTRWSKNHALIVLEDLRIGNIRARRRARSRSRDATSRKRAVSTAPSSTRAGADSPKCSTTSWRSAVPDLSLFRRSIRARSARNAGMSHRRTGRRAIFFVASSAATRSTRT